MSIQKDIALKIVQTGKLSTDQMLEVGNKANDSDVWQAVADRL